MIKTNQIQECSNIATSSITIPVNQATAVILVHMFNNRVNGIKLNPEDLNYDGASLVISSKLSLETKENESELIGLGQVVAKEDKELRIIKKLIKEVIEEEKEKERLDKVFQELQESGRLDGLNEEDLRGLKDGTLAMLTEEEIEELEYLYDSEEEEEDKWEGSDTWKW